MAADSSARRGPSTAPAVSPAKLLAPLRMTLSGGGPVLIPVVLDQRNNSADHCQPNQGKQCRLVVLREEPDDVPAINCSQAGNNGETNSTAQRQRGHKFLAGILHGACRQQKRAQSERRRQQGRHRHREKSPTFKALKNLCRPCCFESLRSKASLPPFRAESVCDVAADDRAHRGHERVVPPQTGGGVRPGKW